MAVALLVLLVVLILFGIGFAVHVLWWIAIVVFIFWLIGWAVGRGETSGRSRSWYRR